MNFLARAVFAGAVALVLAAACASPAADRGGNDAARDGGETVEEARERSRREVDEAACRAGGGEVRQAGMMGLYQCITPYADAGEICRDRSDCEGRCMGSDDVTDYDAAPGAAVGRCEADDSPFGCYATIEDGTPSPFICVD